MVDFSKLRLPGASNEPMKPRVPSQEDSTATPTPVVTSTHEGSESYDSDAIYEGDTSESLAHNVATPNGDTYTHAQGVNNSDDTPRKFTLKIPPKASEGATIGDASLPAGDTSSASDASLGATNEVSEGHDAGGAGKVHAGAHAGGGSKFGDRESTSTLHGVISTSKSNDENTLTGAYGAKESAHAGEGAPPERSESAEGAPARHSLPAGLAPAQAGDLEVPRIGKGRESAGLDEGGRADAPVPKLAPKLFTGPGQGVNSLTAEGRSPVGEVLSTDVHRAPVAPVEVGTPSEQGTGTFEGEEEDESYLALFPEDEPVTPQLEDALASEEATFIAVNPLLADDDDELELLVKASEEAKSLAARGGLADEFTEVAPEELATFTGFDETMAALLADDDDDYAPSETSPAPVEEPAKQGTPAEEFGTPLSPRTDLTEKELASQAAARRAKAALEQAEASEKEFKSEFIGTPVAVVPVTATGRTKEDRTPRAKRVKKEAPSGKLNKKELEFFKKLATVKGELSDGLPVEELKVGPLGRHETGEEKLARLTELERVMDSRNLFRAGRSFKMDNKTVDTLSFLAMFRYATHAHLARMFGESPRTTYDRMNRLRHAGLVASKKIYSQHAIWFLTEPGVIVSGYDVRHITEARLTPSMFPHQFTVNHVAANLMGGKLNVLALDDFPSKHRLDIKGQPQLGETLTSELEILSSFSKIKLFEKSSTFRPRLIAMRDNEFARWSEAENKEQIPTPELVFGNEWMFTMFPSLAVGVAYHVPDLVVKRQRSADGRPQSIAVEIEINNKAASSYERSLRAYAEDNLIFKQVIWVCKTVGPAKKLEKVGRELGLIQSNRLKIVPIWTNEGVFKGKDLWTI